VIGGARPAPEQLFGELPLLGQAIDETLRLYPPAWIGPRRSVKDFEWGGHFVPAGAHVAYCSWASHRLPDVFPDAHDFRPERFEKAERAKWPAGAYVPFGGGPRVCIGRKFGYTEVHAITQALLARFKPRLTPEFDLKVSWNPTLAPKGDRLPVILERR
jgi:cytochrome P450